jgi:hypothetical protein
LSHLRHWIHHWHLHTERIHIHQLRSLMHELILLCVRRSWGHERRLLIFKKLFALSWVHCVIICHPWVGFLQGSLVFFISTAIHLLNIWNLLLELGRHIIKILGSHLLAVWSLVVLIGTSFAFWFLNLRTGSFLQQLLSRCDCESSGWVSMIHWFCLVLAQLLKF